ncbi:MAG: zinc ribbon domain-containing protein [Acidobacteria bacterium]|nr:zinc ribbon domain-containing protein [Acidobacteriota bacterium]
MSLAECPECGHTVSDRAFTCPNCGHPLVDREGPEAPPPKSSPAGAAAREATVRGWTAIASGALLSVGSLIPWRTATIPLTGTVSIPGTEGDGIVTLVLGVIIALGGAVVISQGRSKIGSMTAFAALRSRRGSCTNHFGQPWMPSASSTLRVRGAPA